MHSSLHRTPSILSPILLIILAGLTLRALYLLELPGNPDYVSPAIDAEFHDRWAYAVAVGDRDAVAADFAAQLNAHPYLRPPGYPVFLSGIYKMFGTDCFPPRAVQMLLGLLNVLLLYALARRIVSQPFASLAALLAATYWVFIYYEGELLEPALLTFLVLAALNVLLRHAERPAFIRMVIAGLLLGLAALTRPNVMAFALCLPVWLAAVSVEHVRAGLPQIPPRRLALSGFSLAVVGLLLGLCLPVGGSCLRNLAVSGEFVPISANAGINLYIGNHAGADGMFTMPTELGRFNSCNDYPEIVASLERAAGRPVGYAEASRIFTRRALQYVREHPARFVVLTLKKAWLFWAPVEIPHNKVEQSARRHSAVLRRLPVSFAMIFSWALAGLFYAGLYRRVPPVADVLHPARRMAAPLLLTFVVTYYFSFLPFFIVGQYRAPVIPILIIFAAAALEKVYYALLRRAFPFVGWMLLIWLVIFLVVRLDFTGITPAMLESRWHFDRGVAYERIDQPALAVGEYAAALQINAGYEKARLNLANLMLERNLTDQAIVQYKEIIRRNPRAAAAYNNLSRALAATGRRTEALEACAQALEIAPDEPIFLKNMSDLNRLP